MPQAPVFHQGRFFVRVFWGKTDSVSQRSMSTTLRRTGVKFRVSILGVAWVLSSMLMPSCRPRVSSENPSTAVARLPLSARIVGEIDDLVLSDPGACAFSSDGRYVYAFGGSSARVTVIEANGRRRWNGSLDVGGSAAIVPMSDVSEFAVVTEEAVFWLKFGESSGNIEIVGRVDCRVERSNGMAGRLNAWRDGEAVVVWTGSRFMSAYRDRVLARSESFDGNVASVYPYLGDAFVISRWHEECGRISFGSAAKEQRELSSGGVVVAASDSLAVVLRATPTDVIEDSARRRSRSVDIYRSREWTLIGTVEIPGRRRLDSPISQVKISRDGKYVALCTNLKELFIVEVTDTVRVLEIFEYASGEGAIVDVDFDPHETSRIITVGQRAGGRGAIFWSLR